MVPLVENYHLQCIHLFERRAEGPLISAPENIKWRSHIVYLGLTNVEGFPQETSSPQRIVLLELLHYSQCYTC